MTNKFIYLEESFDPDTNQFILNNYDQINQIANKLGYEFIYFPKYIDNVQIDNFIDDFVHYFHPTLNINASELSQQLKDKVSSIDWYKHILELLNLPKLQYPAIIKTDERRPNINPQELIFNYLRGDYKKAFNEFLRNIGEAGKDPVLLYRLKKKEKKQNSTADDSFQEEAHILANDVIEKINYLKSHGMESLVAEITLRLLSELDDKSLKKLGFDNKKQLEREVEQPRISRLCVEWVSKYDFQITLPDYGNMVV
ncbi:MAG TPA: hypothetical protein VJ909_07125, partial [Prolixibacteraceae bacterium]|nr:hypothetical protein [Prolixibacteraceae bacterium]